MELDDLKNNWDKIDEHAEASMNKNQLLEITQSSYLKNVRRIFIPEIFISAFYLFLLFFFVAFNKMFDNQTLKILSYLAMLLLLVLPILSLMGVYRFYQTGKLMNTYNETLSLFKKQCKQFINLQYLTTGLNMLLLLLCVILIPRIYSEELSNTQTGYLFDIAYIY